MEGIDFTGLATVITSIAVLIGALAAAYATITQTKKVKEILSHAVSIDHAVNNRLPDAQTIGQEVSSILKTSDEIEARRVEDS